MTIANRIAALKPKLSAYTPAEQSILYACLDDGAEWEEAVRYLAQNPPEPFKPSPAPSEKEWEDIAMGRIGPEKDGR